MKPPVEQEEVHHRHAAHGSGFVQGSRRDRVVISTVVIGVALFLLVGTPYLKYHLSSADGIVNAIGGGDVRTDRDTNPDKSPDTRRDRDRGRGSNPGADSDREAVRRWLRVNADDPRPREVRWWPARELGKLYQDRLDAAREAADDDPRLAQELQQLEDDGPDRVCRLEYRCRSEAGDEITRDDLFLLRQGKARLLSKNSSLAIDARRSFPDGEGRP